MRPLRVVLVLVEPPLPFGKAAARWYYVLLKGLVERGHAVTAFAACSRLDEIEEARALFPSPDYDLRLYPFPARSGIAAKLETLRRPYSYMFGETLRRDLEAELTKGVDVLHLETTWCGWVGLDHVDRALVNVLNLYAIDLAARPPASLLDGLRRHLVCRAERKLLRHFRQLSTLTPRLTEEVGRINGRAAIHTVPLGMDLSLYPFEADAPPRPPVVGLIGSFDWEPTLSAGERLVTRLWPEVQRQVPEARLQIIGRQARAALGRLATAPGIDLFEDVPEIIPYFRSTDVLLYAPGPASGMKVKVLEAFALGTAVVTNADGVEGLAAEDGVHAGLAEDDAGLIRRTVELLSDPGRRANQRTAARALMEATCDSRPVLDRLERVYATLPHLAADRPAPTGVSRSTVPR